MLSFCLLLGLSPVLRAERPNSVARYLVVERKPPANCQRDLTLRSDILEDLARLHPAEGRAFREAFVWETLKGDDHLVGRPRLLPLDPPFRIIIPLYSQHPDPVFILNVSDASGEAVSLLKKERNHLVLPSEVLRTEQRLGVIKLNRGSLSLFAIEGLNLDATMRLATHLANDILVYHLLNYIAENYGDVGRRFKRDLNWIVTAAHRKGSEVIYEGRPIEPSLVGTLAASLNRNGETRKFDLILDAKPKTAADLEFLTDALSASRRQKFFKLDQIEPHLTLVGGSKPLAKLRAIFPSLPGPTDASVEDGMRLTLDLISRLEDRLVEEK